MKKVLILFLLIILFPKSINAFNDTSKSSIVMDLDTGRILYQKDSNTERLIASTTKIMTFLITLTYASDKLDNKVVVGEEVLKTYGTSMYLSLNEEVSVKDLLYGLMLRSGNDASVVLATYVGGSIDNFVYLMNLKAKEIGMNNTIFKNPHGLDEETKNYSTAYDLAILTRYLYLHYPLYREISGTKYYDFSSNLKSYSLVNRSKIIFTYDYITSCKNGYTPLAGKSLITTATKNNLNLVIVTINDPDIYENHQNMYEKLFDNYQKYEILNKDTFKVDGNLFNENYYIKNNFSYPLMENEKDKLNIKIVVNKKNNLLGTVNILLNDKLIHEEPIYQKDNKEINKKDSILKKILDFFKNFFK